MLRRPRAVTDLSVFGEQDQARGVGVDRARHQRRQRHRRDQLTGRQCGAALVVGEQNRRHRNGFGDRARHVPVAEPLQRHDEVDRVRLDAVELLGHHQRRHAEVGQLRPHLAARARCRRRPRRAPRRARRRRPARRRCWPRSRAAVRRSQSSRSSTFGAGPAAARR